MDFNLEPIGKHNSSRLERWMKSNVMVIMVLCSTCSTYRLQHIELTSANLALLNRLTQIMDSLYKTGSC